MKEAKRLRLPREAWLLAYCAWENEATSARVALELRRAGWPRAVALVGGWEVWEPEMRQRERQS